LGVLIFGIQYNAVVIGFDLKSAEYSFDIAINLLVKQQVLTIGCDEVIGLIPIGLDSE
jgi:hypothetical protein